MTFSWVGTMNCGLSFSLLPPIKAVRRKIKWHKNCMKFISAGRSGKTGSLAPPFRSHGLAPTFSEPQTIWNKNLQPFVIIQMVGDFNWMASILNLLFQQDFSHQLARAKTSKRIYKTRRSSLNLYEEVGKLNNCMGLPRFMLSSEIIAKQAGSSKIRHSDQCQKMEIACENQSSFGGIIGDYLNKQIQVNDSCQVGAVPGHFVAH